MEKDGLPMLGIKKVGRALAEVVKLMREKWYSPVEDPEIVDGPTPGYMTACKL
jgi:hypothetical protein